MLVAPVICSRSSSTSSTSSSRSRRSTSSSSSGSSRSGSASGGRGCGRSSGSSSSSSSSSAESPPYRIEKQQVARNAEWLNRISFVRYKFQVVLMRLNQVKEAEVSLGEVKKPL